MGKNKAVEATQRLGYWQEQIAKASTMYSRFHGAGESIVDKYRIEKVDTELKGQDKYNILYSSTETVKPSLYAQTPKVEVKKRHRDRKSPVLAFATQLLETVVTYAIEETDFDEVMNNVVEDYTLPGLGMAWVRYEPSFKDETDAQGKPVLDAKGQPQQLLESERVALDYTYWKDVLFGPCRYWSELPWGARRVYMSKKKAAARFGDEKANALQYVDNNTADRDKGAIVEDKQAIVWEIWDKAKREVVWYSDGYSADVLDVKPDPLKLKNFWPFPKPLRAISSTRTFVPRPFYSQYQAQAEELDNLTGRIRHLTDALQVRGVYDSSVSELAHLLSKNGGNKMIAIQNWQQFAGGQGIQGSIQWVPIKDIVAVLMELYKAREIVKAEIYEITGFSDIVRGQSKASETLGAQQIKQDWASARLRVMQREVQRYTRDLIRLMGEIISEHFSIETLALYGGFEAPPPPTPEQQQHALMAQQNGQPAPPDPAQQAVEQFQAVVKLLKSERDRCANIDIETDSTILADEEGERKDRLEFLGQIGAFLQQAAPTAQQFPEMRGLLGAMMMFSVRTFRASRPIEQEFERFQDMLTQGGGEKPDEGAAKAKVAMDVANIKVQADAAKQDKELAFKASEADKDRQLELQKLQAQAAEAQVQLQVKQADLQIKGIELEIKKAELALKQQAAVQADTDAQLDRELKVDDQQHRHASEDAQGDRDDHQFEAGRVDAAADRESGDEGA